MGRVLAPLIQMEDLMTRKIALLALLSFGGLGAVACDNGDTDETETNADTPDLGASCLCRVSSKSPGASQSWRLKPTARAPHPSTRPTRCRGRVGGLMRSSSGIGRHQ